MKLETSILENIRIFLSCALKFHFPKNKNFFWNRFFKIFSSLGLKVAQVAHKFTIPRPNSFQVSKSSTTNLARKLYNMRASRIGRPFAMVRLHFVNTYCQKQSFLNVIQNMCSEKKCVLENAFVEVFRHATLRLCHKYFPMNCEKVS